MFSQRFVAALLLICYGIPAAVGSSWHHHVGPHHCEAGQGTFASATCHGCHAHQAQTQHPACHPSTQGAGLQVESHSHCSHGLKPRSQSKKANDAARRSDQAVPNVYEIGDGSPCSICNFYSLSAFPAVAGCLNFAHAISTQAIKNRCQVQRVFALSLTARGPPPLSL